MRTDDGYIPLTYSVHIIVTAQDGPKVAGPQVMAYVEDFVSPHEAIQEAAERAISAVDGGEWRDGLGQVVEL